VAFRDDREVLKQRANDLERELAEANDKLEAQKGEADRVKKLEDELAEARGMLNRIEAKLPKQQDKNGGKVAIAIFGVIGVGLAVAVAMRGSTAPPPPPSSNGDPLLEPTVVSPPAPRPVASVVETAQPAPREAPVAEVKAHWTGKAKRVTGAAVKVGSPCAVDAVLRASDKHEVTISCGEVLYRSTDALSGESMMSSRVGEYAAEKPGHARAALAWDDIGTRTGPRTQASLDSQAHTASAWSETVPSFRVDIEIPTLSDAYEGAFQRLHSFDALAFKAGIERGVKVIKTKGGAPIQAGALCRARLSPNWGDRHNCRVLLWCGNHELYGSGTTGFTRCEVAEGKPTAFRDESLDGDPMLTWEIAKGTIALTDGEGNNQWSADFSVAPPAAP
jgi:hypothetical protein